MAFIQLGLGDFIQEILRKLMNEIFAPILKEILLGVFNLLWGLLQDFLADFMLQAFTMWLRIVDYIASLYNILVGVSEVSYRNQKGLTILQALFRIDQVTYSFIIITGIAVILAFGFSIISVIRSMGDSLMENKRPISVVMRWALKSALTFMMIPLLCLFMLHFSKSVFAVTSQLEYTDTREGSHSVAIVGTTPGDMLFVTMVQDAIRVPDQYKTTEDRTAYVRQRLDYYMTELGELPATKFNYKNIDQVLQDVDSKKVNYLVAFISVIFVIIMMGLSAITLVRRMVELLVLYIVSPFFAATIALDGGAIFKKWKDLFIGKFFAGFGTMIAMKLFLMVLPYIASNRISYDSNYLLNQIITILFVLGGAWAVYNASITIGQVLDPDSAQEEQQQRRDVLNYIRGRIDKAQQNRQNAQALPKQPQGGGKQG